MTISYSDRKAEVMSDIFHKAKIVEGPDNQWHVQVLGANGEIVLTSENFVNESHAQEVAEAVGAEVPEVERVPYE
jgi:uncharacterized protein YegP (UPF0339 family)